MLMGREATFTSYCARLDYSETMEEKLTRCGIKVIRGKPQINLVRPITGIHDVEIETMDLIESMSFIRITGLFSWRKVFADPLAVLDIFACQNPAYLERRLILTFFLVKWKWYYLRLARLGTGELECTIMPVDPSTQFSSRTSVALVKSSGTSIWNLIHRLIARLFSQ